MPSVSPLEALVKDTLTMPSLGSPRDRAADEATAAVLHTARDLGLALDPYDARLIACAATEAVLAELRGAR